MTRRRAIMRLFVLTALAGTALAALAGHAPRLSATSAATGEQLAVVCAWVVAAACAAWITVAGVLSLTSVALPSAARARAVTRWCAPRVMRRIVEAALTTSVVISAGPLTAAVAAPAPLVAPAIPPPRAVVAPAGDQPVVRAPAPAISPPRAVVAPAGDQPVVRAPRPIAPAAPSEPRPAPARPTAPSGVARPVGAAERRHIVVAGDNFWRLARAELVARGNPAPDTATIARYWHLIVERNRASLRSHDPNLIYPGEVVALPAPT